MGMQAQFVIGLTQQGNMIKNGVLIQLICSAVHLLICGVAVA
jgi:hypothetical protein